MSKDMIATTVRLPEAQIDALDSMAEEGEIPNRSEGIRAAIGFALDSEDWEVSDDARKLAAFKRTKRLSKVHFYREGFRQMVIRVLQTVGQTQPPWSPDQVQRTAPKVFADQIETLFETEERREWARDVLQTEIEKYEKAYMEEQPEAENPYVEAFEQEADDRTVVEKAYGEAEAENLVPEAVRLLTEKGKGPVEAANMLSKRKGVDADKAIAAVEQADAEANGPSIAAPDRAALTDGGEADD